MKYCLGSMLLLLSTNLFSQSESDLCGANHLPLTEETKQLQDILENLNSFKCPSWIKKRKSIPKCSTQVSKGRQSLPETYPKAFIILGSDISPDSAMDMIGAAVRDNPKQLPVFASNLFDDEFKIAVSKKFPEINWNEHAVRDSDRSPFPRDTFVTTINSSNEMEILNVNKSQNVDSGFIEILKKCDINFTKDVPGKSYNSQLDGGNFLTLAPGINVTTSLSQVHKESGYDESNTVLFPKLTSIGHIDEIIQPMKLDINPKNGCPKLTTLVASPDKTKELLLNQNRKDSALGFFNSLPVKNQNKKTSTLLRPATDNPKSGYYNINKISKLCDSFYALPARPNIEEEIVPSFHIALNSRFGGAKAISMRAESRKPLTVKFTKEMSEAEINDTIIQLEEMYKDESYLKEGVIFLPPEYSIETQDKVLSRIKKTFYKTDYKYEYADSKGTAKHCNNLTSKDVYQTLNSHPNYKSENLKLQEEVTKLKLDVETQFKKTYPQCPVEIDWIDVPVILQSGNWTLPNSINSLPLGANSISMPEPYSPVFKEYLEKELKNRKITPVWVDTLGMNNIKDNGQDPATGNLHCLTNTIPLCSGK